MLIEETGLRERELNALSMAQGLLTDQIAIAIVTLANAFPYDHHLRSDPVLLGATLQALATNFHAVIVSRRDAEKSDAL
jgi:hypothetical protein